MRREMFIHKINGTIPSNPHYAFAAEKADECSGYDLADDGKLELYARRCYYPWNRPGFTMKTKGGYKFTPCGVSGGLPGAVKAPYGQRAELYSYPNAAKTTWIRGKKARVDKNLFKNNLMALKYFDYHSFYHSFYHRNTIILRVHLGCVESPCQPCWRVFLQAL